MTSIREIVDHYLALFSAGRWEEAFHGLIDLDSEIVPELIASYDSTTNVQTRAFILEVVSEFQRPISLAFLKQELSRDDPQIWKVAFDGLSKGESPLSIETMTEAIRTTKDPQKKARILKAIRDATIAIKKQAE